MLSFSGGFIPKNKSYYKGNIYTQEGLKIDTESCLILGKADEYMSMGFIPEAELFSNPLEIFHEEGHKFPSELTDEDFIKLKDFIKK